MKCNKCGSENPQVGKFCTYCGNDMSVNRQPIINNTQQNVNSQYVTNSVQQPVGQIPNSQQQTINNQNITKSLSKTSTVIFLVLCILSFNILGIIFCAISLSAIKKANSMPDGEERNKNIKKSKTFRLVAIILYVLQLIVTLISVIIMVSSVGSLFGSIKDAVEEGNIEITDNDYEDAQEDNETNNNQSSSDKDDSNKDNSVNNSSSTTTSKTVLNVIANSSNVVTTGNGLYKTYDYFKKIIYRYKSSSTDYTNVNNYVKFNGELWRILTISEDGTMKLIGPDINSYYDTATSTWKYNNIVFDDNSRYDANGYCNTKAIGGLIGGCNLWAATTSGTYNTGASGYRTFDFTSKPVTKNSKLYDYLNSGDYWNTKLSTQSKQMLVKGNWYYGPYDPFYLESMYALSVNAYVGLIDTNEYNNSSTSPNDYSPSNLTSTWVISGDDLKSTGSQHTGNGDSGSNYWENKVFTLNLNVSSSYVDGILAKGGKIQDTQAATGNNIVKPVVYISNKVKVTGGNGTETNPYIIELK